MEEVLDKPGTQILSVAWAIGFLLIGLLFVGIWPYPAVILLGFPIFVAMFLALLWDGFYRTPNLIRLTIDGLEFHFRTRKTRLLSWQDVEKVDIPPSDPATLHGRHLATARLSIIGEKRPYTLRMESAMTIKRAMDESTKRQVP